MASSNSMNMVILGKLIVAQLVKKLLSSYGTRRFIPVSIRSLSERRKVIKHQVLIRFQQN
jgi:hypothetical protein